MSPAEMVARLREMATSERANGRRNRNCVPAVAHYSARAATLSAAADYIEQRERSEQEGRT